MKNYVIRHKANKQAYIKIVIAPPRLCEWTQDISKAQHFEIEREAVAAAEYITSHAFNVEAFNINDQSKTQQ